MKHCEYIDMRTVPVAFGMRDKIKNRKDSRSVAAAVNAVLGNVYLGG